jgi:hypothetical protein
MNGSHDNRIVKLEGYFVPQCPVYRGWREGFTVCVDEYGHATRSEQCPACGRIVPIRHTLTLVGVNLEDV